MAMQSMPSMPSVPLMSARPSLASSTTGSMPAATSRSAESASMPSAPYARPSPISTSAQCESGARSPLQPSEPYSCTFGVMPALSSAAMVSATTGRIPVRPDASVLRRRNISARTTSRSTGSPMPAACERISERCSCARSSGEMCRFASAPKPVEMPYFGSGDAASSSTRARATAMPASAFVGELDPGVAARHGHDVVDRDAVVVEPDDGLGHGCSFGTSGDGLESG